MKFTATEIAEATGGAVVRDGGAGVVLTDTRTLDGGSWFLALAGERFDAHDFAGQAASAGALGAVFSRAVEGWSGAEVRVADTTVALQDLGRAARDRIAGPVVGLTGSAGKTTTRAMLALALGELGTVHQTVGNLNNQLGVPMTLCAAPEDCGAAVVEMGTSSHGEIALLADIARPDVRIVLNVGAAHLEELGGLEGVAREKGTLLTSARPGDVVIRNRDDVHVMRIDVPEGARSITYGNHVDADVRLVSAEIHAESLSTRAEITVDGQRLALSVPSPGLHLASNAASAIAAAFALGLDLERAAKAIGSYEAVGMRLRCERLPNGVLAINDAYNANPDSMKASLRTLAALPGRRVAVLGDMLELGTDEAQHHTDVAEYAMGLGLERVVLVGPRMRVAAPASEQVWTFESGADAVAPLSRFLTAGDTALFKGSRGARVERILQALAGES
ncbi:MAG: UDP-N-acetylmuramoyl-tripeptide--D-alanyl-D-alanine ligase [Proteobacteria bacterium]|nr:UDP-N-acetylmuramoyl-tripeptide--D-alanyl-D-alanine ligase [Pseudomonadota bacterium]